MPHPTGVPIAPASDALAQQSNLTHSQRLIWLGQKLNADAPLYNMVHTFTISGHIEPATFQAAFQALLDRSDALRTVIEESAGLPQQRVRDPFAYPLETLDFSTQPDPDAVFERWLAERRQRRLDLTAGLFDTALLKLAPARWVWYFNQHHLITDVLSFALTFRRVSEFYGLAEAGRLAEAPALPAYAAYREQERADRHAPSFAKGAAYWRKKLADRPEPTHFYGRTLQAGQPRTERVSVELGPERSARLRQIAHEQGIRALTPDLSHFHMFAGLLFATLHRLSGQSRLAVGTPFHNRTRPAFKETIGLFMQVTPLLLEIEPAETFRSLIKKSMAESFANLRHAQHPLESAGGSAYDVVLNYLTATFGDFAGRPTANRWVHAGYGDSHHALRLQVHDFEAEGTFTLYFDFNLDLFDETRQQWFIAHFLRVLDQFLADRDRPLGQFDLLSEAERQRLLLDFNQSATPYPAEQTVVDLFEAQAARTPQALALRFAGQTMPYAELNRRANRLAHYLTGQGAGPETIVGLCVERSPEAVIGMLGVLKAGAAYLPLDPAYPPERLAFMLSDSQSPLLLTQQRLRGRLPDSAAQVVCLDADWPAIAAQPGHNPAGGAGPDNLAYVIYTSGSTGRPKGAMIEHRGLTNYLCWAKDQYTQGEALAFPLFSSLSFDLTVTSIYTPLISGGEIVIYGEETDAGQLLVLQVIEDNLVEVIKLTPAHLALLKAANLSGSRLRRMIVGGEDFKRELAQAISDRFAGRLEIYNEYGPTETVVGCMIHRFDPARDRAPSVPIGRPAANTQIYLLDRYGQPVPPGVTGELHIGGPGVARGYLNRPDLTAERFLASQPSNPPTSLRAGLPTLQPSNLPTFQPSRLYRTGDLARWSAAGQLEFLGRADDQVKIKGVRIELGEIEAALLAHPAIEAAVVTVTQRGAEPAPPAALNHCLKCGLPATYPAATFDEQGVCNTCRDFEAHQARVQPYFKTLDDLRAIFAATKPGRRDPHDCLVLLSGGKDSTYMLYQLVNELGLRPLVFSLDNGYISEGAKENIRRVCADLDLELVWGQTPHMNAIFADSLKRHSNVCNGCFKTIYTLSMQVARQRGIKYIVTGLARGQLFETRLSDMLQARTFDVAGIDRTVLEARKAYHRLDDAVNQLLDVEMFEEDAIFEEIEFIDFYRYTDVQLDEMYAYLDRHAPWVRPADTGRSTNCLINDVGIYIHKKERGYHNYALPYSWDVRMGHKVREAAMDELDDEIDERRVRQILREIGYEEPAPAGEKRLTAYYVAAEPLPAAELKAELARHLPEPLLPSHFIRLAALPLTANGKLDRRALPDPEAQGLTLDSDYVAPTGPTEQTLARVWAEVFRLERVGVQDNFFDLGGDSIISIQIIAKAGQAGLHLTPRQLFQHQTITELAEVAGSTATVQAEQGLVSGRLPLTPIQRWFFEQNLAEPDHWNQSLRLELPPGTDPARLEQALRHLLLHHDALRLRFEREGDDWRQVNAASPPPFSLVRLDLAGLPPAEQEARLAATLAELEAAHDLTAGRLLQAAQLDFGPQRPGQLFLTLHHLAVDGVSWQTLLQDIETAYAQLGRGEPLRLPPKTTAFKQWAEGLAALAQSAALRQEFDYWLAVTEDVETELPLDFEPSGANLEAEANLEAAARTLSLNLSREETTALLREVPAAYNSQINDVLLTAFAQTMAAWTGRRTVLTHLEGHGREEVLEQVDLSRTVGWFTSLFPVKLALPDEPGAGPALKAIKEQLRAIPQRGIGYGLLRYLSGDARAAQLAAAPAAPVLFNYLGQFDRVLPDSALFRLNQPLVGSHSQNNTRRHLLDVNTFVIDGRLHIEWTFAQHRHRRETIARLAGDFADALRGLIGHCLSPEAGGFTPSDFPLARLSQPQLDRLLAVEPEIEDIYPLSSLQQGMLFHTLYAPHSGFYVLQFSADLPEGLDLARLAQAWQEVTQRHAVLRSRFVWEGLAEPLQVVHRTASLPVTIEDWRDLPAETQAEKLAAYGRDRARDFSLPGPALMSLRLIRLSDRRSRMLWNFHHILFDRWSMSPLLAEVIAIYTALSQGQPLPARRLHQYRDYIAWVQRQDMAEAERFWRRALAGFSQPTPLLADRDPGGLPGEVADFGRRLFNLPPAETERLTALAQQQRLTLNTIIQGAWGLLLSHWSGRHDVLFGSIVPGRPADLPGAQTTVGLFMNTLPLRLRVEPERELLDWLAEQQAAQLALRQFDYSPLVAVQGWSEVPRGTPLFDSIIGVQRAAPGQPSLLRLAEEFGMSAFDLVDWNSLPLSLAVEVEAQVTVVMKYDHRRFDEATGARMADQFERLLRALIARPERTVQALLAELAEADRAGRQARKQLGAKKLQGLKRKRVVAEGEES